ncbi:hypothetical protein EZJ43_00915 [Pedobacter changchengzhani]|uniref:Serine kinase n=1 Tax=Pedobacter changchengzhani TaxID=2529274 RepID=A0A4R5MPX2_9SPHI|nr:hypothetical protein [Pedobacter changchengzhani]TDG37686.1 hypothetical protein EZJ43_00915 [Pedobacter changchengzhani]
MINYTYALSGFVLKTNFHLPELTVVHGPSNFEIIVNDQISAAFPITSLRNFFFKKNDSTLIYIKRAKMGYIEVCEKKKLVFTPLSSLSDAEIKMHILGTCYMLASACLGYFSFHAACVVINGKAVLFCGDSGAGKSTLAAHFFNKGYTVLSDDVTNIKILPAGEISVFPSLPRIKLSVDTLSQLRKSTDGLSEIGGPKIKYSLPINDFPDQLTFKLGCIVFPTFTDDGNCSILPMINNLKKSELSNNFYRAKLSLELHTKNKLDEVVSILTQAVDMFSFTRPSYSVSVNENINFIEEKLLGIIKP